MSEENEGTESHVPQEEEYIYIFYEDCDLTNAIINLFTNDKKIMLSFTKKTIRYKEKNVILDYKFKTLDKYKLNKEKYGLFDSLDNVYLVKLSDLLNLFDATRNDYKLPANNVYSNNCDITCYIKKLVNKYNTIQKIEESNIENYYSPADDGGPGEVGMNKRHELMKIDNEIRNISMRIKELIISTTGSNGGKPSRKRKTKKTKRRKNTQKKNTKKRSRK